MIIVSLLWSAPVGVINLMVWVEVALIVCEDMVSDALVIGAAYEDSGKKYRASTVKASTILKAREAARLDNNELMII